MKNYFVSFWLICAIANSNMFDKMKINDIHDFQLLNIMFSWQCWASYNTNLQTNLDAKSWICNDKYANSINIEIANALGFCLNDQKLVNKFNCKKVKIGDKEIVKFNADPIRYTRANWNAVVLYNYILLTMYDRICFNTDDKFFDNIDRYTTESMKKVADTIFEGYQNELFDKDKLKNSIDCATRDIKEYVKKTNLNLFINSLKTNWKNMNNATVTPIQQLRYSCFGFHNKFNFDTNTNSGCFVATDAIAEIEGRKIQCNIEVTVKDGKISEYKLYDTTGNTNLFNEIARFKTIKDNLRMGKNFIEYLWQGKLLPLDKIHNLVNVTTVGSNSPYVTYKCYLNSVLQALHASHAVREEVVRLSHIARYQNIYKLNDISPIVINYFEMIEEAQKQDKKIKYEKNTKNLADVLEYTNAHCQTFNYVDVVTDEERLNKLNAVYNRICKDSDWCEDNNTIIGTEKYSNFNKNGHMLRSGRESRHATTILTELLYALNTEALEKQEEQLTPERRILYYYDKDGYYMTKETIEAPYAMFYNLVGDFTYRKNNVNVKYERIPKSMIKDELICKTNVLLYNKYDGKTINHGALRYNFPHMLYIVVLERNDTAISEGIRSFKTRCLNEITRSVGDKEYKYRLVSSVDYAGTGGHFVAKLLTKEGWVEVDDTSVFDYVKLGKFVDVTPNGIYGDDWNKNHNILIYERVY